REKRDFPKKRTQTAVKSRRPRQFQREKFQENADEQTLDASPSVLYNRRVNSNEAQLILTQF
ncbi:MAG: hypothetical protein IJ991_05425, partial [Thermoguttaceae bacterium]|nr:hypothetical protein [Thermoguttaceae bacterium]